MSLHVNAYARTRPATARARPPKETPTAWAAPVGTLEPVVPAAPEVAEEPEPPVVEREPVVTVAVPLEEAEAVLTMMAVPLAGTLAIAVLVAGTVDTLGTAVNCT